MMRPGRFHPMLYVMHRARVNTAMACLSLLSCLSCEGQPVARQAAVARVSNFMRSGDTTELRLSFSDSVLTLLPIEGMAATRGEWISNYGTLKDVTNPQFDSVGAAHLEIVFEQTALAVELDFDTDDRISFVSVSMASGGLQDVSRGRFESQANGPLRDIVAEAIYKEAFNADSGNVRLIALLSPT